MPSNIEKEVFMDNFVFPPNRYVTSKIPTNKMEVCIL